VRRALRPVWLPLDRQLALAIEPKFETVHEADPTYVLLVRDGRLQVTSLVAEPDVLQGVIAHESVWPVPVHVYRTKRGYYATRFTFERPHDDGVFNRPMLPRSAVQLFAGRAMPGQTPEASLEFAAKATAKECSPFRPLLLVSDLTAAAAVQRWTLAGRPESPAGYVYVEGSR